MSSAEKPEWVLNHVFNSGLKDPRFNDFGILFG